MIIYIIAIGCVLAAAAAIRDYKRMQKQEEYFQNIPIGDIGYFEQRIPVSGIHSIYNKLMNVIRGRKH